MPKNREKLTSAEKFITVILTVTEIFLLTVTITVTEKLSNLNHTVARDDTAHADGSHRQ